ncbi:MAG TPA: hypothetical protein ENJ95_05170 [Bacteroidetes bacterium]|nr:hypothetical protein [Bacteroidota bacterium]
MYRSNIYPKLILLVSFMAMGLGSAFAQLEFKLQLMDDDTWGVYVKPVGITPSTTTITGSGQVTLVTPDDFTYSGLTSLAGLWQENAVVTGPIENPTRKYISFGMLQAEPSYPIPLQAGEETLLFTIDRIGDCPDTLHLIDCGTPTPTDPFCPPNSETSNPGNDLSVIDFGAGTAFYYFTDIYAPSAWSCHDCDGDGILNGLEDTNGNGTFDPGIDSSAMCDPCDPYHIQSATLDFVGGANEICAGDALDTAYLVVTITNVTGPPQSDDLGWDPFTIQYTNGTDTFTVANYASGDSIAVVPTATDTYSLVMVTDSFSCEPPADSLMGDITISVNGPLTITTDPSDVTECSEDGTTFTAAYNNAGDGTVSQLWQISTDGGATYVDLQDGAPYDDTDSLTMSINPTAGLHGMYYRMKIWTPVCDTVYSAGAQLLVEGPLSVTTDPVEYIVCDGSAATFSAAGANAGAVGTLQYQWQVSTDSGSTWSDVSAGAVYSNVTTTTLTVNAVVGMDGYLYRMAIYTNTCNRIFTASANLDVEGPITVTDQPDDVSNCSGNEVFFITTYTNPGGAVSTTQWEVNDGSGWDPVTGTGVYTGIVDTNLSAVAIDTLTITNVEGLNGNQYRLAISTGTCTTVYSNAATLDVSGSVTFTQQPPFDPINVCAGSDTIIVACASIPQGSFSFAWEYSTDGGATWNTLNIAGDPAYDQSSNGASMSSGCDTLIINDATGLEYTWYRAVAVATDCINVTSDEARLIVEGPLSVNTDPVDVVICSGDPVEFSAAIDNAGDSTAVIQYQWQVSLDNTNWLDIGINSTQYGGINTTTLLVSDVAGLHDNYYRMSATTSDCGFIYTASAHLTVEGPITITQQPSDSTLCYNDQASFTSTANVGTAGTLSYQWQVSSDNTNWTDIGVATDGGVYTGYNTTTLNVTDVTGLYNRCYRMAFTTGQCLEVYSDPACLNIQGPFSIDNQPDDITECSGDPVSFYVGVAESPLNTDYVTDTTHFVYQWQENDGSGWVDLTNGLLSDGGDGVNGVNTGLLDVFETAGRDNHQFRALIWSNYCDSLTSTAATLFIEGPVSFSLQPRDTTQCEGTGVSFTAATSNPGLGTPSYNWQLSTDDGATWADISNGGDYSITGATTTTIVYDTVGYALNGNRIRLKAWTSVCDTVYSEYAVFTVEGEIGFTQHPSSVTACSGDPVCFEVATSNAGSGNIYYQWELSLDGSSYVNVSNSSTYSGAHTYFMCISDISGLDSVYYRARIYTDYCAEEWSNPALLVEEGPVTFIDHPDDITQCSAEAVEFCAEAQITPGNSGTITYQWQASSDGINYADINDGGGPGYIGTDSTCLTVTNVAGLDEWRFRLTARTGVCSRDSSFSAQLNVEGPLSISAQPSGVQNCDDAEALFTAQITNPADPAGLQTEYVWEILHPDSSGWSYLTNGTSWNGINTFGGANSDTLLITPLSGLNGSYIRMKGWTSTCDTLTTDSVLLAVEGPLTFTDDPDDVTLCSTDPVQFTVAIDNATGVGTVQYQWEVSANGIAWSDVSNVSPYSGATTNQLSISNTAGLYNYKYRCKIRTGTCNWTYSTLAQLFVEGPISIDLQPTDQTVCDNRDLLIDTEVSIPAASSGALTFQWQVSSDGGSSWANLSDGDQTGFFANYNGDIGTETGSYFGTNSEDLTITLVVGLDGYMYRMLINTSTCSAITDEITLTVQDACTTGGCDFDGDGTINSSDYDMDNDQLVDSMEVYLTDSNTVQGWNYLELDNSLPTPAAFVPNRFINYSTCDIDSDNDGLQDNQEDPDGDQINNGEETDNDGVFDGDPLDPCSPILGPTCIGVQLAIDIYLQGGHIGNGPSEVYDMRDDLREKGYLPVLEPYTAIVDSLVQTQRDTPFVHVGDGGGEYTGTSILSVTGADAVIDWVFVELRSSTNLDSVITTRAALLQADGDVVDVDGVSDLSFTNAPAGPYYVVVRHRNHLGIMTAEAMDLSPIVSTVDFTDPATPTYGEYGQVEINGVNYLWGGDFNANGRVVYQGPYNDINYLFADIVNDQVEQGQDEILANWITLGYERSDINLDGQVIYQGPSNDRALMLFNTTLSHPLNTGNIANFVIESSLP